LFIGVLADFYSEHLLGPIEVIPIEGIQIIVILFIFRRKLGHSKLVLTPEELYVQQLVNQVTNNFARALYEMLRLAILGDCNAKLAQIVDHLLDGIVDFVLKVFEIYEYAKFARLHN